MTEYALSIFGMSALLGALSLIHYNKNGPERAAQRVLFAAVVLLPLLNTVISFNGAIPSIPPYTEGDGEYCEVISEAFANGVKRAVCEKFSLSEDEVEVSIIELDMQSMRAEKIKVTLTGIAITSDRRAIEKFIEGEGLGDCEVRVRVG